MFKSALIFVLLIALAVKQSQGKGSGCLTDNGCYRDCTETEYGLCAYGECVCVRKGTCVFDGECQGKVSCPEDVKVICSGGLGAYCMCEQPEEDDSN